MTATALDIYEVQPFIWLRDYAIWREGDTWVAYERDLRMGDPIHSYRHEENIVATSSNMRHLTRTLIPFVISLQDEKDRHR